MKIRNPWIIKLIGFVGAWLIRIYMATLCYRFRHLGPNLDPRRKDMKDRYIYAFFHENILLPCAQFAQRNIHVLISQHADGEMIARICHHLGYSTIRGSKSRGGIDALRKMMRASGTCHIAVMPDGPRGPRRHVELGMIYLAARTRLPIVLIGVGYRNPWRLPTWDRFAIPRPFSTGYTLSTDPIEIPADLNKTQLEEYRQSVELALQRISEHAESLANR